MALEFGGEQITPPDFGNESASPIPERPLKLSVKNLVNITTDVNDWYMMGVQVDIEPAVLKRIEEKDPAVEKRKLHMFEHWLSTDETASWDKLATALDNMHKYKLLATRIRNIHRGTYRITAPLKFKRHFGTELLFSLYFKRQLYLLGLGATYTWSYFFCSEFSAKPTWNYYFLAR